MIAKSSIDNLSNFQCLENTTSPSDEVERATFRIVPINEELLRTKQKQKRRKKELELLNEQITETKLQPITTNSPPPVLSGRNTDPEYKYNVLVIPKEISEFNKNNGRIIFKPRIVKKKYSGISSGSPEINDGIFEHSSPQDLQRIDLSSNIQKRQNPISYSYDFAVNDGPEGPVISKSEQSDGVLTKVPPL